MGRIQYMYLEMMKCLFWWSDECAYYCILYLSSLRVNKTSYINFKLFFILYEDIYYRDEKQEIKQWLKTIVNPTFRLLGK